MVWNYSTTAILLNLLIFHCIFTIFKLPLMPLLTDKFQLQRWLFSLLLFEIRLFRVGREDSVPGRSRRRWEEVPSSSSRSFTASVRWPHCWCGTSWGSPVAGRRCPQLAHTGSPSLSRPSTISRGRNWPRWPTTEPSASGKRFSSSLCQCCISVTFWYGSGSANTYLWLTDSDPAIFVGNLQDGK